MTAAAGAKRAVAPLTEGRVRLRLLEEADLPMTLAWRNRDDIRRWFFTSTVITAAQHRAWFEQYKGRDDDFVFVIDETETLHRPVGQASLYHVDWAAGRAEFGRLLIGDDDARGLGVATAATRGLVDMALGAWGLREVHLECRPDNAAALAVYRRCGFRVVSSGDVTVMVTP